MTSGEKHLTVKIIQRCQVYLINQYLTSKYLLEAMILELFHICIIMHVITIAQHSVL